MRSTTSLAGARIAVSKSAIDPVRKPLAVGFTLALLASAGSASAAGLFERKDSAKGGNTQTAQASSAATRESLADLLLQLEQLQTEVRDLRGQLEVQSHEMEKLKARNRDLSNDLDQRLRNLERRGAAGAPAAIEPAPSAGAPVAAGATAGAAAAGTSRSGAVAAPVAKPSASDQEDYDAAFALMKQGFYERAAKSFRGFIEQHPTSPLAGNAQYWIGEASYYTRNFKVAVDEFQRVLSKYPTNGKVPDAMLKIGYSYYELADYSKARDSLTRVVKQYPNTTVAKSAEGRLNLMKKEGR